MRYLLHTHKRQVAQEKRRLINHVRRLQRKLRHAGINYRKLRNSNIRRDRELAKERADRNRERLSHRDEIVRRNRTRSELKKRIAQLNA